MENIMSEMVKRTGNLSKKIGSGLGMLKFVVEWLENP
ncbi:unnamed protein product, partial [marine sediment metagenome]